MTVALAFGLTAFSTDRSATPAEIAVATEEAGFRLLLFPDHTHVPVARTTPYPGGAELPAHYLRTFDPIVASAWAIGATDHLRIGIGVCLVPARDPIVLAKQVASLDVMSGGRFVLGVGAGWNVEEVADHGVHPAQRWAVIRERVLAIREIWTRDEASFHGRHVSFDPMWSWPKPVQRAVSCQVYGDLRPELVDRLVASGVDRIDLAVAHGPPGPMVDEIGRLGETIAPFRG